MKHLKKYDSYINENLLLECKLKTIFWHAVHNKVVQKWGLNLYFVGTFQMGVTILYPIIDALVKNSQYPDVTPEKIVLMTIFSITQILRMTSDDIKKMREELEEDGLITLTEKIKESLLSVYKIFTFVSRSFGKVVDVFTDMLAYVSLCVPVASAITEMVSKDGLNLDTLPRKVLVFAGGLSFYAFKSLVEAIIIIVKNKMTK